MKIKRLLIACILLCCCNIVFSQVHHMPVKEHPRLFLFKQDEAAVKQASTVNVHYKKVVEAIHKEAENMLALPLLERKQIGRRLLSVSREAIRRILYLSYTYRVSGDKRFSNRAVAEMSNIAKFSDWNPSHFLDVAEMTTAMAIGYDWLHHLLPPATAGEIRTAIIEKGLKPSLISRHNGWLRSDNNWNQVCNAGMTLGALAIYEDDPELANSIINRAIESIKIAMKEYGPDGAYPEGSGYWEYGTSYNVLFLSALEKIYKTDFGLTRIKGFMNSANYMLHVISPSGHAFNYADNGTKKTFNTAVFWFAAKNHNAQILTNELAYIKSQPQAELAGNRFLPMLMIWGKDIARYRAATPQQLMWTGNGLSPVAMMRTSWTDRNAIYLGFKAGSANVNHAHMDVGSFIMEANCVRWAMDFGMQNYESLEAKGMRIFGKDQYAQRWTIFRYINTSHNTLTINDSLHRVNGRAEIDRHSYSPRFMFAQSNMTAVFGNEVKKAVRGVGIRDKQYVVVQDEIETGGKPVLLRWSMVTPADVKIVSNSEIQLKKDGKELLLKVHSSLPVTIKTWSTTPTTSYDAANPGTIIVGFEAQFQANTSSTFMVHLLPQGKTADEKVIPLAQWQ